jgi:hypothetical protein
MNIIAYMKVNKKCFLNIIFFYFLLNVSSCASSDKIIYLKDTLSEEDKIRFGESAFPFSICIAFENSTLNDKILIENFTTQEVYFDGKLTESTNIGLAKVLCPMNAHEITLQINGKIFTIDSHLYQKFRFLIIKKEKNRHILTFTNQPKVYW